MKMYYDGVPVSGGSSSAQNQNVYSTEETVVGVYMGKPLYRKVLPEGLLPTVEEENTYIQFAGIVENIEQVVSWRAKAHRATSGNDVYLPITIADPTGVETFNVFSNTSRIQFQRKAYGTYASSWNGASVTATIEYTKTTD